MPDGVLHNCVSFEEIPDPYRIISIIKIAPLHCTNYLLECSGECLRNEQNCCDEALFAMTAIAQYNASGELNLDLQSQHKVLCNIENDRVNGKFGLIYEITGWEYIGYSEISNYCEAIVSSRLSFCNVPTSGDNDPDSWGIERYIDINKYVVCPTKAAIGTFDCCFVETEGSAQRFWFNIPYPQQIDQTIDARLPTSYLLAGRFIFNYIVDHICVFESHCAVSAVIDWKHPNDPNWNRKDDEDAVFDA